MRDHRTAAERFADLALDRVGRDPAADEIDLLKKCLVDVAAATVAARHTTARAAARRFACTHLGDGDASLWFEPGARVSPFGAAFVNATAASALDIDDGNRAARGHISACLIPAATAVGAACNVDSREFARALLAGYEIGARLGAVETPGHSATGRWVGVGVAAAVGILIGLDRTQLGHAIALAAHTAPMMAHASRRKMMYGHLKEGVGFAALAGLQAAYLATEGFKGDIDAIESTASFDLEALRSISDDASLVSRTYFKLYSCCRLAHAPIDAALHLQDAHRFAPDAIDTIRVESFRTAIDLPNEAAPASFEGAQYSLPFTVALAICEGPGALLPMTADRLTDVDVLALSERVTLVHRPDLDTAYPDTTPASVEIRLRDGTLFEHVSKTARGDPALPLDRDTLTRKFVHLARGEIPDPKSIATRIWADIPSPKAYDRLLACEPAGADGPRVVRQ